MSELVRFYKGEETGIVQERYSDINKSLFKEQYDKALRAIDAYLDMFKNPEKSDNDEDYDDGEGNSVRKENNIKKASKKDANNVFAFIGERGTGKTSCMESVAAMLGKHRKKQGNKERFLIIDPIDPSTFTENTNMLQVVIGVLFEKFSEEVVYSDKHSWNYDTNEYEKNKQEVINSFQDVKECIKYISNPKLLSCEDDDITQLAGMASVSKLSKHIEKLTDNLLKFFDKKVLILQIDDIDLQTKYANQMVEELRKYFLHKNILVLMAVKLEQLAKVIENENAKLYSPLHNLKGISLSVISSMAERYLLKLIPVSHRIYMPVAEVYINNSVEYYDVERSQSEEIKPKFTLNSIKYGITQLIFEKCRFLFYHTKGEINPIVPHNLRELRHLMALLADMEPYDKWNNPHYENKTLFLDYFNNVWVDNNIDPEDINIVENVRNIKDAAKINKTVIQLLRDKYHALFDFNDTKSEDTNLQTILMTITRVTNASYNISIADVYTVLDYIKQRINSLADRMLIFFIETFYSIKLYAYYDEVTDKFNKNGRINTKSEGEKIDESIVKREVIDGYSNYEILAGGNFINTDIVKIAPDEKKTKQSRVNRDIKYSLLKEKVEKLVKAKNVDSKSIDQFRLCEFFALCITRTVESLNQSANEKYRTHNELYYRIKPNTKYLYAQFNIGSFFFNIMNVENTYDRIYKGFFKLADETKDSLYKSLLATSKSDGRDDFEPEHALLSCAAIRNYEVYDDFMRYIEYDRLDRSVSVYNSENLEKLFNKIAGYYIKIYDRNDENNPYKITFKYVSAISKFLQNVNKDAFDKMFRDITAITTEAATSTDVFDIESIMQSLPKGNDFAVINFRRAIYKSCSKWLDMNPKAKKELDNIYIFQDMNGKRITKQLARIILTAFEAAYKFN